MARRLVGDRQLRRNMAKIARLYDAKAMDFDMEDSLEPLRRETEGNARPLRDYPGKWPGFPEPATPPKGGHLDEGVVSARVGGNARRRTWWVSFAKRARKIAHLVEFGTAPHFQPKFRGGWLHPGAQSKPFFRPAFDSKNGEVLGRLGRRVMLRLQRAAATLRRR